MPGFAYPRPMHDLREQPNGMKSFFWSSRFLAFMFTLTLISKAISDASWRHPGDSQSLGLKGAESTDSTHVHLRWTEGGDRVTGAITWASISLGGALASVSLWASLHAKTKGPLHWVRAQRVSFYLLYHAGYILPLVTFAYLTYKHSQSDHFSPTTTFPEVDGGRTCVGLCSGRYFGARFDRETWACDLHAAPEVHDPTNISLRICVCETVARWSLLVLGLAMAALAGLLEWDRRGGKTLVRSWKVRARDEGEVEGLETTYHILLQ